MNTSEDVLLKAASANFTLEKNEFLSQNFTKVFSKKIPSARKKGTTLCFLHQFCLCMLK